MKIWILLLPGIATILGIAGTGLYLFQDKLIYFPRPYAKEDLTSFDSRGGVTLSFSADHGEQVAFYVPSANALPDQIWCCFAGIGGQALAWEGFARRNAAEGRAFLFVEWPSYGASQGKPRPATVRASTRGAAIALADYLGMNADELRPRFAVLGHSMGAAGALLAAEELGARRALLFSPYTSLRDMALRQKGPLIGRLLRHDYDNRAALASLAARPGTRVTIFHGTADELIPIEMARELHERHPATVRLIELPGADHNNLFKPAEPYLAVELAEAP